MFAKWLRLNPETFPRLKLPFQVFKLKFISLALPLLLLSACSKPETSPAGSTSNWPEKPIKVIIPTNAGGEIDALGRLLQRAIEAKNLLSNKIVIVNLPGAGGTLGTRRIKQAPADGYTLGLWSPGFVTSKAMGIVDFDHNDFELICMSGFSELALGVREDSRFQTVDDLLKYAKENPRAVKFSTNVGLPVHLIPLLFAEEAGIEFGFIQSGGGSQRLASILGGHTDISMFATTAFVNFGEAGLKPIVSFSPERDPLLPDVPTATEYGLDVQAVEIRVWVAPKGTPKPILEKMRSVIETVMSDPEIAAEMTALGVVPKFGTSEVAQPMLDRLLQKVSPLVDKARSLEN